MSLTDKQRAIRRSGITATDVRVLAGVDPHGRTPHDVWRAKVLGEEDFVETEATELGTELEPIVIPRLARKVRLHALRVDPETLTRRHPTVAHHIATPDALLAPHAFDDPCALGQIKVVGLHNVRDWGDQTDGVEAVPEYVLVQCAWELHVTGLPVNHVGVLAGTEVRVYTIQRDAAVEELIGALEETADRFWTDHVLAKAPPIIDGSAGSARLLKALFPTARGPVAKASPAVEDVARNYFAAKTALDHAKAEVERAKQLLITACGEAPGMLGDGWRLSHAMRAGYHVDAYDVPEGRRFDMRRTESKRRAA